MERLPYFDTHAHLDTEDFDADREALLQEIGSHMLGFINPGCDVRSSKASLAMAHRYDYVYAAVGLHPEDLGHVSEGDLEEIYQLAQDDKVVAIGEIGLDYYNDEDSPHERQQAFLIRQLAMARELKLKQLIFPIITPCQYHAYKVCCQKFQCQHTHKQNCRLIA